MTSSRFDPDSTSKTLNISLLRFNEWFRSKNLVHKENMKSSFLENANGYTMVNYQFKKFFYGKIKNKKFNVLIVFSISHKSDVKIFQKMDY